MTFSTLNDLENDAFSEIINIGMGRAAKSLSEMVNDEVKLSVPSFSVVSSNRAITLLDELAEGNISGVTQDFSGTLNGRAMLLFPEEHSLNLVRLLLKDAVPLDMMSEMEKEALMEVGNIILNACFGTVSNTLDFDLNSTIPDFLNGSSAALFASSSSESEVLMLKVDFSLPMHDIRGFVTFIMNIDSSEILKEKIRAYVRNLMR